MVFDRRSQKTYESFFFSLMPFGLSKMLPGIAVRVKPVPRKMLKLTNTAGFLGRPLVVLLTSDVLLSHQLKGRQALEVQLVPVTKARSFPLTISWDSRISATALFDFYGGRIKSISH